MLLSNLILHITVQMPKALHAVKTLLKKKLYNTTQLSTCEIEGNVLLNVLGQVQQSLLATT